MPYGTVNADVIGTSVAGSNLGAGNASIMKNRIINGAMVINQRGFSGSATDGSYTLDRWFTGSSQASKFTVSQNAGSVTPPTGFTNYLGATSSSAYTVGSGEHFDINQFIEGYNVADLGWGTANAKTVTLSFQVYSSLTGTFGGAISNSNVTRSYPFTYSIPVANTWTSISITIAGDTGGSTSWVTTNGIGLRLWISLGAGSTLSGTAGSWAGTDYRSATGATSVVGTNGATFYITGVQLEVGSSATGFEYRQYGTELALCQRYYYKNTLTNGNGQFGMGVCNSSTEFRMICQFPVTMRTNPTSLDNSGTASNYQIAGNPGAAGGLTSISFNNADTQSAITSCVQSSGLTQGYTGYLRPTSSTTVYLGWSAEL
jgi:hypothetical protein